MITEETDFYFQQRSIVCIICIISQIIIYQLESKTRLLDNFYSVVWVVGVYTIIIMLSSAMYVFPSS